MDKYTKEKLAEEQRRLRAARAAKGSQTGNPSVQNAAKRDVFASNGNATGKTQSANNATRDGGQYSESEQPQQTGSSNQPISYQSVPYPPNPYQGFYPVQYYPGPYYQGAQIADPYAHGRHVIDSQHHVPLRNRHQSEQHADPEYLDQNDQEYVEYQDQDDEKMEGDSADELGQAGSEKGSKAAKYERDRRGERKVNPAINVILLLLGYLIVMVFLWAQHDVFLLWVGGVDWSQWQKLASPLAGAVLGSLVIIYLRSRTSRGGGDMVMSAIYVASQAVLLNATVGTRQLVVWELVAVASTTFVVWIFVWFRGL